MKKKVSISVYLVFGGIGLIFLDLYSQSISDFLDTFDEYLWLLHVSLLVVIAGTIWGFVDWMRTVLQGLEGLSCDGPECV